jgi:hypothetical protein
MTKPPVPIADRLIATLLILPKMLLLPVAQEALSLTAIMQKIGVASQFPPQAMLTAMAWMI